MQTFTGKEYVRIAIANAYGMDKEPWKDRIDWVNDHLTSLEQYVLDADEPFLFTKAVNALRDTEKGIPTGYVMGLDATTSGYQLISLLVGCEITAANTNAIYTGNREDFYIKISERMNTDFGLHMMRKDIKKPTMTVAYGSEKQPEQLFGKGTPELKAFYSALTTEAPGAMDFLGMCKSCTNKTALEYIWEMPDRHVVVAKSLVTRNAEIRIESLDIDFKYRAKLNAPDPTSKSLGANIVHSIDGYVVREMVRRANREGFQIMPIHDCFYAGPNHMQRVRQLYVDIMVEISQSNLLQDILRQVTGNKQLKLNKNMQDMHKLVRSAEYALS